MVQIEEIDWPDFLPHRSRKFRLRMWDKKFHLKEMRGKKIRLEKMWGKKFRLKNLCCKLIRRKNMCGNKISPQ